MSSCLYKGNIEHRRFAPKRNVFSYQVLYYFLDLDEIKSIFKIPFLFSYNKPAILSFWRKDYLGEAGASLKESVQNYIEEQGHTRVNGPIRLLTNISYFGFCFNPVSFYYCYNQANQLQFIVSEITNTPWGEKHRQLFPFSAENKQVYRFPKEFHVSPFLPMAIDYTWVFQRPEEELYVLMQDRLEGKENIIFDSTLKLKRRKLTAFNIGLSFVQFPFTTFKTVVAIYWQALKLFIKNVPVFTHPKKEKIYDNSTLT